MENLPALIAVAPGLALGLVVGAVAGIVLSLLSARRDHADDPDWVSRADWWQWGGWGAVLGAAAGLALGIAS